MPSPTCQKTCGALLVILGLCAIGLGVGLYVGLPELVQARVIAGRTILSPSEDASSAAAFAASSSSLFYAIHLFNVSNCAAFLAGSEPPQFVATGPYVYVTNTTKLSVSFSPDNTLVSYKTFTTYTFNATLSTGNVATDSICALNPAYLAVLAGAGDGTESSFLLLLTAPILTSTSSGLTSILGGVLSSQLPATACNTESLSSIPAGFADVFAGVSANLGAGFAAAANLSLPTSFSASFMSEAFAQFPTAALASSLFSSTNLALLPTVFLDEVPAGVLVNEAASSILATIIADSPGDLLVLPDLELSDYRLILCGYNHTTPIASPFICTFNGLTPSSALLELSHTGLVAIQLVLDETLSGLNAATGTINLAQLGALQWTSFALLKQPVISPSASVPLLKPLELAYVDPTNTLTAANAVTALESLYGGITLGQNTSTVLSAFAALVGSPAYIAYLESFIFTEAVVPALLQPHPFSNVGTALGFKRYIAFFNAPGAHIWGSADFILINGATSYNAQLTLNWAGLASSTTGYKLAVASTKSAADLYCTTSYNDTIVNDLTSFLSGPITLSGTSGTQTFPFTFPLTSVDLATAVNPEEGTILISLSGPNGDYTAAYDTADLTAASWTGACATLNQGSLDVIYNTMFSSTSALSFELPANIVALQGHNAAQLSTLAAGWLSTYGVSATYLGYLYTPFTEAILSSVFANTNATLLPQQSGPAPHALFYDQLFYIQIGTAYPLSGTSIKSAQNAPASIQELPFYPEIVIQSVDHVTLTGGFTTTSPYYFSYKQATALMNVLISPTAFANWYGGLSGTATAYWTNQVGGLFSVNDAIAANQYLQYAVFLTTASAWLGGLIPVSPPNPIATPTEALAALIATPAVAIDFLMAFQNGPTCKAYLNLSDPGSALVPFSYTSSQYTSTLEPYFASVALYAYNVFRASNGLPTSTTLYGNIEDFFYLQLATQGLIAAFVPGKTTFNEAITFILQSESRLLTDAEAAELAELSLVLGSYNLEIWSVSANAPDLGSSWVPFGISGINSFPAGDHPVALTYTQARDVYNFASQPVPKVLSLLPALLAGDSSTLTTAGFATFTTPTMHAVALNYLAYITQTLSVNSFNLLYAETSGLFVTRTAQQWIEGYNDPLLAMASPSDAIFGYAVNPNLTVAEQTPYPYYTYYTRGANLGLLHDYNGSTITTSWKTVQTIDGASDGTSVPPGSTNSSINVFVGLLDRVLTLSNNGSSTVQNIATTRYVLDVSEFEPSASPDILVAGAIPLGGLPGAEHNTPLFASLPMFCYLNLTAYAPVSLLHAQTNCGSTLATYVDIDVLSGLVFNAQQQLQINAALDYSNYNLLSTYLGAAISYNANPLPVPAYYADTYNTISAANAAAFNNEVNNATNGGLAAIIVLVVVGVILLIIGSVVIHRGRRNAASRDGLQEVNSTGGAFELSKKGY